ncbi:hypothetical protein PybrP1_002078 [[Pythium] brassicae (nom. inval.)]|nr:hypothetical protein PybrP1_002078 [[Pythium] brassicae (nom. inval.)]
MLRASTGVALSLRDVRRTFEQQRVLSVPDTLDIVHAAQELLTHERNLVEVQGTTVFVFGDIHGQFYDLMRLLDEVDLARLEVDDVKLVFLGDYVDRGAFSCEVILFLLLLKVTYPTKVFLLRGNHECETISSFYGFRNECHLKYGISVYSHFVSCFQSLPIAALVRTPRGDVFCVHGGISPDLPTLAAIDAIDRHRELPAEGALCDLLWSDPAVAVPEGGRLGAEPGKQEPRWTTNEVRGCSFYFSAAATFDFLVQNRLLAVVRAHEYAEVGYMLHFDADEYKALDQREDKSLPPLITVFSAANYCDVHGNLAAYLVFHSDPFSWEIKQLAATPHPSPPLPGAGRSSDIWKQFQQTLPFLPASRNFFDDILVLAGKERSGAATGEPPAAPTRRDSVREDPLAGVEDPSERRRRLTSEMHPQAINQILDAEASKWVQSDDDAAREPARDRSESAPRLQSSSTQQQLSLEDRSKILSQQEMDTIKLVFSLIDADGSMTLSTAEVTTFIRNVLGERISPLQAQRYLEALDFDRDGVVDFADILSWTVVVKRNYEAAEVSATGQLLTPLLRVVARTRVHHVFMVLMIGAVARDLFVARTHQFVKHKSLRVVGYLSALFFAAKAARQAPVVCRWTSLSSAYKALAAVKARLR